MPGVITPCTSFSNPGVRTARFAAAPSTATGGVAGGVLGGVRGGAAANANGDEARDAEASFRIGPSSSGSSAEKRSSYSPTSAACAQPNSSSTPLSAGPKHVA